MGKVYGALYVLKVLLDNDIVKAEELSEGLGCTKRQIRKYINDLKKIGVNIGSKTGNNGGYFLKYRKCPICGHIIGGD